MNVLNIDALAALKRLDEQTVQYLCSALGVAGAIPAYTFVANRFGYDMFGPAPGNADHVTFYPVKDPELNGEQVIQSLFYGDCFFSFYIEQASSGPWSIKVFADSPHTIMPQEESEMIYYASNIVNTPARYEVVRLAPPRIPLTSMRIVLEDDVSDIVVTARCSFVGLFVPKTNVG